MTLMEMIDEAMPNLPVDQKQKIELHILNNFVRRQYEGIIGLLAMVYGNYQR